MKTIAITVSGRVQGVWYRASTKREAQRIGVAGFVRNEPDGTVYMEATGEEDALKELIAWCHDGPGQAVVQKVTTREIPRKHYEAFTIQ